MSPQSSIDVQLLSRPVQYIAPQVSAVDSTFSIGGECVFLGRTRADIHPTHGKLLKLEYEAYASMAIAELERLAAQATIRFECRFVRIHHALGEVPPGEASVMVQTFCSHRDKAFESCRFLIDALKQQAPIWKRELWQDGSTWSQGMPVRVDSQT